MELKKAHELASALARAMKPYVERGAIAGSIRRRKPEVKDIELVIIPKWEKGFDPADLLQIDEVLINTLFEFCQWSPQGIAPRLSEAAGTQVQWIKPGTDDIIPWHIEAKGKYWRAYLPEHDCKVDIFLATPENWGGILLIRTGPAEYSQHVMIHAKRTGYKFEDGHLWQGSRRIPVPEEKDVFEKLWLEWVEPHNRYGADQVRNRAEAKPARPATARPSGRPSAAAGWRR